MTVLKKHSCRNWLGVGLTGVWAVLVLGMISALAALHDVPISAAAGPLPTTRPAGGWRMVHVLAEDCPCSGVVGDALVHRRAGVGVGETVVVTRVDHAAHAGDVDPRYAAAGFDVHYQSADDPVEGAAIQGAPWLLIIAPDGRIAYSGGYAASRPRAGTALLDQIILNRLQRGETVAPLPAFGCMTDRSLQRSVDPLGLKY